MRISGAMIIRNGVKLGYPFIESIKSILPVCDEVVVGVGDSEDGTRDKILSLKEPKIRIIDTVWDMTQRTGGKLLSIETNKILPQCKGEWIFYIQADEVAHQKDYPLLLSAIGAAQKKNSIDGLSFDYLHFYGSYSRIQTGRNWYKEEVRIIRNGRDIVSHGDAQGFRRDGKKIRAIASGARIFHYGWARPPEVMAAKIKDFNKLWHDDNWVENNCNLQEMRDYFSDLGNLSVYNGDHPEVMKEKVAGDSTEFIDKCRSQYLAKRSLQKRFKDFSRSLSFGRHLNFTKE